MRSDLTGRVVGIAVFLGGIGLMVFVFAVAYSYFASDASSIHIAGGSAATPSTAKLGESAVKMFAQIGLLIVMALVSSLVASRGAQLYFAATASRTHVVTETREQLEGPAKD